MLSHKGSTSEYWHCSGLDHFSFACPPLLCDFIRFSSSLNTSHVLMLRSWSNWGLPAKPQIWISTAVLIPALIFLIDILHLACPQTKHPLFPYEPGNENTTLPVARAKTKQNKIKHKQTPLVLTHPPAMLLALTSNYQWHIKVWQPKWIFFFFQHPFI